MKGEPPNCGLPDNFMLYANIIAKLISDEDVRSTNIDIKALKCQVILMGIVASSDEIDRAMTYARGAEGVVRVQSFLEATRIRAIVDVPKIPNETATEPSVLP